MRACLVAYRLSETLGLKSRERSDIYYATLLRYSGVSSRAAAAMFAMKHDLLDG